MNTIELSTKACTKCGETKPLSEFHRARRNSDGHHAWCKPCTRENVLANKAQLRAEIGDEAYRRRQRQNVDRFRRRTGDPNGKAYQRARSAAITALIDLHRSEFEHLLLLARRGDLSP